MVPMRLLFVCLFVVIVGCRLIASWYLHCSHIYLIFFQVVLWSLLQLYLVMSVHPSPPLAWFMIILKEAFGIINFHPWLHYKNKHDIIQTFAQTLDSSPLVSIHFGQSWKVEGLETINISFLNMKIHTQTHTFSQVWKKIKKIIY